MDLCESNKKVAKEVRDFIQNVPDVKEESITDYLVWKWAEIDKRFKFISIKTFTRKEENELTGADFELEIWLIGNRFRYPLLIQAKKLVKPFNSYVSKLNYPHGTQDQIKKLINYSHLKKRLPFYLFYSLPDKDTRTMCPNNDFLDCGAFLADAFTVKKFADRIWGSRVSKNKILSRSNPFYCIVCCPLAYKGKYFERYFGNIGELLEAASSQDIPEYVSVIMSGQWKDMGEDDLLSLVRRNELAQYRAVGVYNMRYGE